MRQLWMNWLSGGGDHHREDNDADELNKSAKKPRGSILSCAWEVEVENIALGCRGCCGKLKHLFTSSFIITEQSGKHIWDAVAGWLEECVRLNIMYREKTTSCVITRLLAMYIMVRFACSTHVVLILNQYDCGFTPAMNIWISRETESSLTRPKTFKAPFGLSKATRHQQSGLAAVKSFLDSVYRLFYTQLM